MVPQQLVEDILGCIMRADGKPVRISDMGGFVEAPPRTLTKAVKSMTRQGLLNQIDSSVTLTPSGEVEANRILRAHRLWETYLQHVGMPAGKVHDKAHTLEHVHDKDSVEYLDDLLGHPTKSPHGVEIPENHAECAVGKVCSLSVIRPGRTVVIDSVGQDGSDIDLHSGEKIMIGPRVDNETAWTIIRANGNEMKLDHKTADSIQARIVE
jgi:manganese/iron transport system permease protein/iron/zinc/copper transport system permease protein